MIALIVLVIIVAFLGLLLVGTYNRLVGLSQAVDAQWAHSFLPGDTVDIAAASSPLVMFASKQSFFDVMREKLHWGARSDRRARKGGT